MMSASMPIPKRAHHASSSSHSSWSSSSASSSWGAETLSKAKVVPNEEDGKMSRRTSSEVNARRPSLLGNSLARSEYTVVNLGHDGAPRLVTCVKSSQGFDWNQELFLPSYADHDSHELEHKQDPVQDIILTDEEAAAMLPQ